MSGEGSGDQECFYTFQRWTETLGVSVPQLLLYLLESVGHILDSMSLVADMEVRLEHLTLYLEDEKIQYRTMVCYKEGHRCDISSRRLTMGGEC